MPGPDGSYASSRSTLSDVARESFVSVTTASRALSGAPGVSSATRERVTAAARALNYMPNVTARELQGSASGPMGLFVGEQLVSEFERVPRLFTHRLIRHLMDGLSQRGYSTLLVSDSPGGAVPRLSALLVVSDLSVEPFWSTRLPGVPVVVAGHVCHDAAVVANPVHDHDAYCQELVTHLLVQGAEHLAILRHSQPGAYNTVVTAILSRIAQERGLATRVYTGEFAPDDCRRLAAQAVTDGADAIFSMLPLPGSVIAGITGTGAHIPQDVLLVGRTEGTVEAQTHPPVSVVSMEAIGCAQQLLRIVDQVTTHVTPSISRLPHRLILRESSLRR